MKFKKILVYNIDRSKNLDPQSWKKIESLGNKIVFVPKDDPKLRKELVDIDSLEQRLKKKDITFILDHSDEMLEEDLKKISKYKDCIIYPPIAYVSKEAADNKKKIFVGNIEAFLRGKPQNVVNP